MVRRWLIRGRVQGVGYRWFVCRQGDALGLSGIASNLADGSVEVIAKGDAGALNQLDESLRAGPTFASVTSVESSELPHEMKLPRPFEAR